MIKWINAFIEGDRADWQWYKYFFNIVILRYLLTWFALIPIILTVFTESNSRLEVNNNVVLYLFAGAKLPFNLKILWIASLCYTMALLLYQIFCPIFIKTYSSYGDYLQKKHSPRWIIWEAEKVLLIESERNNFIDRLLIKGYAEADTKSLETKTVVEAHQTATYFEYKNNHYRLALPVVDEKGNIKYTKTNFIEMDLFWEIFGRFSSSKPQMRKGIIFLLVTSGVLFIITLSIHIWNGVVCLFFS